MGKIKAFLFDMDGVITDTAEAHALAWKQVFDELLALKSLTGKSEYKAFDINNDYFLYLDGKLRQDGIKSFLNSRQIELPKGDPDDNNIGTLAGLSRRKQAIYQAWLTKHRVPAFQDAVVFLHQLRSSGIRTGLFSSSQNASAVLKSARVDDLFDYVIDGLLLEQLEIPGKPDPAQMLHAASQLGVSTNEVAIVEDAIIGIEAAIRGGFGFIIGLDRAGHSEELKDAGCFSIVHSLAELSIHENQHLSISDQSWSLSFNNYKPLLEGHREALCTLGNGYFATRGATFDSNADAVHYPGTYLAGCYNRLESSIEGRKVLNEDLVNLPNWLFLKLRLGNNEWTNLDLAGVDMFRQTLDLKKGQLLREFRLEDSFGRKTRLFEKRLVSMADPHLAAISLAITPLNWSGTLVFRSGIDGAVLNSGVERYRGLANEHLTILDKGTNENGYCFLTAETKQSEVRVSMAARTQVYCSTDRIIDVDMRAIDSEKSSGHEMTCSLQEGNCVTIEKTVAIYTSRDTAISNPLFAAQRSAAEAPRYMEVLRFHEIAWDHLWKVCDIQMDTAEDDETERKLRLHIFHLLQTTSNHSIDRDVGIPARGWHGEAYRGHIFWDELFIFPFLSLRLPILTRSLLLYRYRRLPEARRAAKNAGYRGAMFPWQSGSDGKEETQLVHLNPRSGRWIPDDTHLQRHINSAIAFNIWQYFQATDDQEFLALYGAEIFIEIARFWASVATFNGSLDRYEITGVMGPDEFHTRDFNSQFVLTRGLKNNAYTNVMASWVLTRALEITELLPATSCRMLCEKIGFDPAEKDRWFDISRKLKIPFHGSGIISQFEGYADLEDFRWDEYFKEYGDIKRLDRILESENDDVNRYKVSKQADVLMLFYLFSSDELYEIFERLGYPFDRNSIPDIVQYYMKRTSYGSSLSSLVHSWVLARSNREDSWDLFIKTVENDLSEAQSKTTAEGIHLGAMAGSVDLIQRCYLGLEMKSSVLHFDPVLPEGLKSIRVCLRYRRQTLNVEVCESQLTIRSHLCVADAVVIAYRGSFRKLVPGDSCQFRLLLPRDKNRSDNSKVTST